MVTDGPVVGARASTVFRPWPVTYATTRSSRRTTPCAASLARVAMVTPPAVSAKIPSVRARSRIAVEDLVVRDSEPKAPPERPDGLERVPAVGGIADRERLGDRVRLDRPDRVGAVRESRGDGAAAGGLRARDPDVWPGVEQADLRASSLKPLAIFVSWLPEATGTTT